MLNDEGLSCDPLLGYLCFRGNPLEVRGGDYLNDSQSYVTGKLPEPKIWVCIFLADEPLGTPLLLPVLYHLP